jgi:hypothetical protein
MEELPNPDLVIFKNVLHKNKTENDIMNIILKKVSLLNDDLKKYINVSIYLETKDEFD